MAQTDTLARLRHAVSSIEAGNELGPDILKALLCEALDELEATVSIKPLQWRGTFGDDIIAYALFGSLYSIQVYAGMARPAKLETRGWYDGLGGQFGTVEAAQTAAQTDYEKRIRAALVRSPAESHQP